MIPLLLAASGTEYEVLSISGSDDVKKRLMAMGITIGEKVKVLSQANGSQILSVKGTRVALDCTLARRIRVSA